MEVVFSLCIQIQTQESGSGLCSTAAAQHKTVHNKTPPGVTQPIVQSCSKASTDLAEFRWS